MSRGPEILAACRAALAHGPELTQNLARDLNVPRALIATVLSQDPSITRKGDAWSFTDAGKRQANEAKRIEAEAGSVKPGRWAEAAAITWLKANPGAHTYAAIAEAAKISYSSVAVAATRHKHLLDWATDGKGRMTIAWKEAA